MNYTWDVTKDKESNTSHDENDQESGDSSIDHSNGNITAFNLDAFFNDTYGNLSGSPISTLNSLDFGEWPVGDHLNANSIINNLQFASMESDWAGELASGRITDGIEQGLPEATRDHDCHGEAYKLLGRSLFADLLPDISPCQPATAMLAIDESSSNRLALDQLLLLNRKSSERLGTLLTCSCASKPYLMMLYASCISAILTRYQHAARGALRTSCDSLVLHDAVGTNGKEGSTALRNQSIGPAVAPARVAIGAFSVNNQRVQSALNIQLLAGEVREVVHLIDRFASCQFETPQTGEQSSGSRVNGLHQSLSFWLRGEHSKITDEIRNRLTELNA
jgi:hypothetical protein